ncbi:N-6 DNA methylase [Arcobacteraceae bacterium]|nr:N-6 DNA methylase [Arcobacteraceae bacterium]
MNQIIFKFLKDYGSDEYTINRLLVSSFLNINNINNHKIKDLLIQKDELEYSVLLKFIELVQQSNHHYHFEELVEFFEFVISPSDKLINGAIYTPDDIREFITKESFKRYVGNIDTIKVADISCGCGGFLINASLQIKSLTNKSFKNIFKDNIFGMDIQEYSIERTEILLTLLSIKNGEDEKEFKFNLYANDSLKYNWKEENKIIRKNCGFDLILGNPPYVCSRNMDDSTKEAMKNWSTCSTGHPDLYIPFFQIGYELLRKNGILGYITVNTFIKSLNGRAIRKYFSDKKAYLEIIDFEDEQIFNSRMTYTSICFLQNKTSDYLSYLPLRRKKLNTKLNYKKHKYNKLDNEKGWYLQNRKLLLKLEDIGTKLGDIYTTRSGVATLKNNVYIFKPVKTIDGFYYIDKDTKIEKEMCRNIVNSNLLVKTNQIDIFIEKIIFPYEYDENNQVFVMPISKIEEKYPCAYNYLLKNKDLLSTRDKGKGKDYKYWYAFGRNQSLERREHLLLFPQLAREGFQSHITSEKDLYFYNGMAVMSDDLEKLQILGKLFLTDVFWKYVSSISKHYASGYFSLGRNYIKNFGITDFTEDEKKYLINNTLTVGEINDFVNSKYSL